MLMNLEQYFADFLSIQSRFFNKQVQFSEADNYNKFIMFAVKTKKGGNSNSLVKAFKLNQIPIHMKQSLKSNPQVASHGENCCLFYVVKQKSKVKVN